MRLGHQLLLRDQTQIFPSTSSEKNISSIQRRRKEGREGGREGGKAPDRGHKHHRGSSFDQKLNNRNVVVVSCEHQRRPPELVRKIDVRLAVEEVRGCSCVAPVSGQDQSRFLRLFEEYHN